METRLNEKYKVFHANTKPKFTDPSYAEGPEWSKLTLTNGSVTYSYAVCFTIAWLHHINKSLSLSLSLSYKG